MQFDLFEAMTALAAAVETALPAGRISVPEEKAERGGEADRPDALRDTVQLLEEGGFLTGAEGLPAGQPAQTLGELRALSDRLELEALRYVRFLDMGVNA